jgi:hypothetical protein
MAEWHPCCTGQIQGEGVEKRGCADVRMCKCADVQMCRCADVQMDRSAGSSEGVRPSLCVPNRAGVVGARRIQEREGQRVDTLHVEAR